MPPKSLEAAAVEKFIAKFHASQTQLVLAMTGGGARAIGWLLTTPGGARTVLECVVPYSPAALIDFLGSAPDHYCSAGAARAMAMVAFLRARRLGGEWDRVVGVSCTASLATDRPKRGDHRLYVGCQTGAATSVASLTLEKGRRARGEEERLAATLVLNRLAAAAGIADQLPLELAENEAVAIARHDAPALWQTLWSGQAQRISVLAGGRERPAAVFPGAFNPLHHGHLRMAEVAAELLGEAPAWELSIQNVDKPPLDYLEMSQRLTQFPAAANVWLSRAATFTVKAELFPGATFVVGADTIARIDQPRYYGHNVAARDAAIRSLAERGCRFLVFGRLCSAADRLGAADANTPTFRTLAEIELSPGLKALCREAPAEKFREDVSSSVLRSSAATRLF